MKLLKTQNDEELVFLISQDNTSAFKMLFDRYWKRMLAKAFTQLQSTVLAEEIVQDAFVGLWKRRHTIQLKYTFNTYIAAVVKYEVMTHLSKRQNQPLYIDDLQITPIEDHSTQQWLDFDDLKIKVESLINTLPEKCQLVFRLSREKGLSDRHIAEDLAISHKTVEAHISKALKTLRLNFNQFLSIVFLLALSVSLHQ